MKFTLVLLVTAAIVACALSCSDVDFEKFQAEFGKKYADKKEISSRKEIFCKNLRKIQAHNRLYDQGLSTYQQGVNQFTDMTSEEFQNSGYVMHPGFGKH
ncbi:crustapain-like [Eupeodes corollae]|uniref:crustapain-like n=1 Tax=Eupeodes corollae TaxID=290404 RepID=UPI0024905E43|nr:crustapain-like [Eupeodes corollae]